MPFNGTGSFSLVSGNPVVTGTTISSTVQNNTMSDFATGFSTCLTKDGQQTVTANIPFNSFKITGLATATLAGDALSWAAPANVTTLTVSGLLTGSGGGTMTGAWDYTGATLTAATQTAGDSSTKVATTSFVAATAFIAALPAQTGNAGRTVTTDGSNASWTNNYSYNDPSFGMTF